MFFPFFKKIERKQLQDLMDLASNFCDYVRRLYNFVISEDSSLELVHLAQYMLYYARAYKPDNVILKKYSHYPPVQVYQKLSDRIHADLTTIDAVEEAIQRALSTNLKDWIQFEMYYQLWLCAVSSSFGSHTQYEAINSMKRLVHSTKAMSCFKPRYLFIMVLNEPEKDIHDRIELLNKALKIAIKNDDLFRVQGLHRDLAYYGRHVDSRSALDHLENGKRILSFLGFKKTFWDVPNVQASIHNVRGEFNASVDCYNEAISLKETEGPSASLRYLPHNMSIIHLQMGHKESALEWAMMAFEGREILSDHSTKEPDDYLHMASALAALGRLEEAETQFHRGKELILKTRQEYAFVDYVEGLIEKAHGNAADAYRCISNALNLYERVGQQNRVNYCLVRLAELEAAQFPFDVAIQQSEAATPMLKKLEMLSREKDFPGFLGIALTLLGEIELKRGDVGQARKHLNEAIEISRRSETRYLKGIIAVLRNLIPVEHP